MAPLDLNNTIGALFIGFSVSSALFGVACTQVFFYFQNYSSDGIFTKTAVIILLIFEALHSAFSLHAAYYYSILNYMNPIALNKATWSSTLTIALSSLIMLVVHLLYARRIYYLSRKNIPLVVLLILLILAHLGTGISVVIRAFQLQYFNAFPGICSIIDASLALAAVIDIIIATSLSYYLHTSRSGIESTDTIINKLMVYAINNGIITSVFDILTLALVKAQPSNLIYLSIFQVVGNLYTNSMMGTLNARRAINKANVHILGGTDNTVATFKAMLGTATGTQNSPESGTDDKAGVIFLLRLLLPLADSRTPQP